MSRLTLFSLMGALLFSTGTVMAQGSEVNQRIQEFCSKSPLYNEHVCTSPAGGGDSLLQNLERFDRLFQPTLTAGGATGESGGNTSSDTSDNNASASGSGGGGSLYDGNAEADLYDNDSLEWGMQ